MDRELTPNDRGVTLIELLVVVAILSVLAVGVSITAMRGSATSDASDMAWFRAQFDQHRTLAITSGNSFGLFVGPKELRVARMGPDGWSPQGSARKWRGRVAYANLGTRGDFETPDVVLRASGQSSRFDITFGRGATCRSDGWSGLICDDG